MTRTIYQSSDEYLNRPGSSPSFDSSMQGQSGSLKSQDCIVDSEANESSTGFAHQPQIVLLGSDRRYNNYWLFLGLCRADDPGHRRVYFESSEDGHWEVIDSPQVVHLLTLLRYITLSLPLSESLEYKLNKVTMLFLLFCNAGITFAAVCPRHQRH
jgi:hypothetical protein